MLHIEPGKLTEFLLSDQKLTEEEEGHLLHCRECMDSMLDSAGAELESNRESAVRSIRGPNLHLDTSF